MDNEKVNEENKKIWDDNSIAWDDFMGEDGNNWHKELIAPQTETLLKLKTNDNLLDIGCGNGLFARRMAKQGVNVTAFDFAASNIKMAEKYDCTNIDYQVIDATNLVQLQSFGSNKFQGLVANMVFMDMPNLDCLFSMVPTLMGEKGSFVFSIQHPCFNSEYVTAGDDESLIFTDYINENASMGVAIPTQVQKQFYFHRPISFYANLGMQNGLAITGFQEPTFGGKESVYSKFPPILIIRMEKLS